MSRDCLSCAPDDDFEVVLCVNCYGGRRSNFHTDSNHRASDRVKEQSAKDVSFVDPPKCRARLLLLAEPSSFTSSIKFPNIVARICTLYL